MRMWRNRTCLAVATIAVLFGIQPLLWSQTKGMVMNNNSGTAVVFNADTDTIIGSVSVGLGPAIGDCSITGDQKFGFATALNHQVVAVDLNSVTLTGPPNPISIANPGEDTSITPDQKFMAVCDGSVTEPVSVIDIATRTQVSTFDLGHDCNSVEICSDYSVLVTSFTTDRVRRLKIDSAGQLSDTGEILAVENPWNVICGADAASGVTISASPGQLQSFKIPGLTAVDTRPLTGNGMSLEINKAGDRVYSRRNNAIDVFSYNSATGALGASPILSWGIAGTALFFGTDQLALHPNGSKLYVSQPGSLQVFNAATGTGITSITHPSINFATGVCFARVINHPPFANAGPDQTIRCVGPNGASVTLDGSGSSDLDNDPLTYKWTEGNTQIAAGSNPTLTLTGGVHAIKLTVDDGKGGTGSDEVTITVNLDLIPPTASHSVPAPNSSGWYNRNVTATLPASDNCRVKQITYTLTGAQSGTATISGNSASLTITAEGTTKVTYSTTDINGNASVPRDFTVKIDKTNPVISGMPAAECSLSPPNHKLITVATVTAQDGLSSLAPGSPGLSASSNEPDTAQDIVVTGTTVLLRAERSGTGTGRIYTIHASATDLAGNTATATSTCTVPHDQRKK